MRHMRVSWRPCLRPAFHRLSYPNQRRPASLYPSRRHLTLCRVTPRHLALRNPPVPPARPARRSAPATRAPAHTPPTPARAHTRPQAAHRSTPVAHTRRGLSVRAQAPASSTTPNAGRSTTSVASCRAVAQYTSLRGSMPAANGTLRRCIRLNTGVPAPAPANTNARATPSGRRSSTLPNTELYAPGSRP